MMRNLILSCPEAEKNVKPTVLHAHKGKKKPVGHGKQGISCL